MQEIHHEVEARFDRVRDHSSPAVNRRIDLTAQARAELCARQGRNATAWASSITNGISIVR
jgi:hypothetical protein